MRAPTTNTLILFAIIAFLPVFATGTTDLTNASSEKIANPDKVGMSAERLAALRNGMKQMVDTGRLAGAVTIVARHNQVVAFDAAGLRDVANNVPMQKDSIFRIYSMTKPITGVAMMILFEEGKWQLNDPVSKYIPQFADLKVYAVGPNGDPIMQQPVHPVTMRELMSHTGGFTYGLSNLYKNSPVDELQQAADPLNIHNTLDEFIKRMSKLPLSAQPGSEWRYSVSADIQGYLVQKLSGMPFDKFLEERIFKPLHMVDTGFYVPKEKQSRFVKYYSYAKNGGLKLNSIRDDGLNHDFSVDPTFKSGGAGLVSTATDYLHFCQMLLNGGQLNGVRILSPRTVELMRTNVLPSNVPPSAFLEGSGFGLDFAVIGDPIASGGYYGKGTYYWVAAAGTWFWIDPVNDLIVIGMIQQAGEVPDVRGLSHTWVYQSIVD
jgi:CubicO group peptidase (beta-lactamase class C family)